MSTMRRAENGYIIREEFYTVEAWVAYLRKAMSRRRDYRPVLVVMEETGSAPPSEKGPVGP